MSRPIPRIAILVAATAAPLLALLLLVSCSVDDPPADVVREVGVVEGYVLVCGRGAVTDVSAHIMESGNVNINGTTVSDSTGWYRLELPTGYYRLSTVYEGDVGRWTANDDSVAVGPRVQRRDLLRGSAEIEVRVPPVLEGDRFDLSLEGLSGLGSQPGAWADASGGLLTFALHGLHPGGYRIRMASSGQYFYLPGTIMAVEADTLTVGVQDAAAYTLDLTGAYAAISGVATGSWQAASSASLYVRARTPEGYWLALDQCDRDGSFLLGLFTPRDVRLCFESSGVEQWYGGDSFETASVFALRPGDLVTGVTYQESGIEVGFEGPGYQFDYRADVFVRDEAGREFTRDTAYDSPFAICNLRPGRYFLRVDGSCQGQAWAPQWFDGAAGLAEAVPIDLGPGELRRLVVELGAGGRVCGALLAADGRRPPFVRVGIYDGERNLRCGYSRSFAEGAFSFEGLAEGEYFLASDLPGDDVWWYPGTSDAAAAQAITIVGSGAVSDLVWLLPADKRMGRP